ncbi:hypothetical protein [Nostoc sp.]
MERGTSARFSFLLGLPAVILAGAVELPHSYEGRTEYGWLVDLCW